MPRRSPGEVVALRELWQGRVWEARAAVVVEDGPARRRFHIPAGVTMKVPVDEAGVRLSVPRDEWALRDVEVTMDVLSFEEPDGSHATLAFWDRGRFVGWYINLQSPLRPGPAGFDYEDHLLDIVVAADRTAWQWKDEQDLEAAVARGIFSAAQAEGFRAEGERAVRTLVEGRPPFDRSWEDWRPDPAWPVPGFPDGWDRV